MMTAKQWYEYQDCYKKYGLDMKERTRKPAAAVTAAAAARSAITAKDKMWLFFLLLLSGLLCVGVIVTTAYTASVKYEINAVIKKNAEIQGEIENLTVKIQQATNIKTIEVKAQEELGMVHPDPNQFVFIMEEEVPSGDFAMILKEHAYN